MSIKLMSKVFEGRFDWGKGAPAEPTVKLVLLALADHASDTGEAVYPSIAHVCAKTGLMRRSVCSVIAAARKRGILIAIGKRRQVIEYRMQIVETQGPSWDQITERTSAPDALVPVHHVHTSGAPDAHVIVNESPKEPPSADARALVPSGEGDGKRTRRDALDIQMSFDTLKAQGRAEGRDRSAAAHPMAGRWPHLVDHCRAFEAASGLSAADLTRSQLAKWARDLEGHAQAGLVADDERRLYGMARAEKWKVYSPGSMDSLIATMRKGAATHAVEQPARPLY